MRILVLIAIGLLLYFIISNHLRRKRVSSRRDEPKTEKMVRCQHCGIHVLEKESYRRGDHFYCSQSHLEADT